MSCYLWYSMTQLAAESKTIYKIKLDFNEKNVAFFAATQFNNRNTRKRCEICSKLTMETPEVRWL